MQRAITESLADLRPWMPWARHAPDVEECEENVRQAYLEWVARKDLRLSVFLRDSNRLVASSGLHRFSWEVRRFEIGYWVRSSEANNGYIREAVNAITRFAFSALRANAVEIRLDPENKRSQRVPESLGFEFEGCLRRNSTRPAFTGVRDTLVYSRLNLDGLPELKVSW